MEKYTVSVKGQVVIPREIRDKYDIQTGTQVKFSDQDGVIRIMPITMESIESKVGFLNTKGSILRALMKEKKEENNRKRRK